MTGDRRPPIVVMGVSASGKSSVGVSAAGLLGVDFVDADDLHSPHNVAKMHAGMPLDDEDREPWLDAVAARLRAGREAGGVVIACSALKRAYRDRLRASAPDTVFVHLTGTPELLAGRANSRRGHFMPASLLYSQLEALEPLEPDERGFTLDTADAVNVLAQRVVARVVEGVADVKAG